MNTKYLKAGALALILVSLPSLTLAASVPTVSLNLQGGDIYVGDSFDVEVLADGDNIGLELLAFSFDVSSADSVFSYDNYTIGTGFDDDSSFFASPTVVAGSAFPGIADDDALLATLSFIAIAPGTGTLQTLGETDQLFYGLEYENGWYDIDASLNITVSEGQPHVVPIPSLTLLTAAAMSALIGFARKSVDPA